MAEAVPVSAFLSRVVVPEKLMSDRHGLHRAFWRAFPGRETGEAQPFLFREEPYAPVSRGEVGYVVQSAGRPAWDEVLGLRVASCERVETTFRVGDRFFFRLLASPVRRLMHPDEIRQRHGTVRRASPRAWTEDWLRRRAAQGGFEIQELIFDLGQVKSRRGESRFKLASVQFDGLLEVTDPTVFASTWRSGIGTKRAFGFGLLSLKRA